MPFTVVLDTAPDGDVVVDVASLDTSEATVDKSSLTFSTGTWSVAQTVSVTPVNDAVGDGTQIVTISLTTNTGSTTDTTGYDLVNPANVTMTVLDNDAIGYTVAPTSGLTVSEGLTTDTFTVVLNSAPNGDVVIDVTSLDTTEATVDKTTLTFTTGDWDTAQTVTVTGVNDAIADGNQTISIQLTVDTVATLDTFGYDSLDPPDVSVTNIDDDAPGVGVAPISGLVTSETGTSATFTVVLNTLPVGGDVVIDVTSLDTTEVIVDRSQLIFTTSDWFTPQTVTLTGQSDGVTDGNQSVIISLDINAAGTASETSGYLSLNPPDVAVINSDNVVGVTLTPASGVTVEEGATTTFSVTLNTQPSTGHVVVIDITSLDTTEAQVDKTFLTFDEFDWATPQVVTVTGEADGIADGNQTVVIALDINTGSTTDTSGYLDINPPDFIVITADNGSPGVVVIPVSLTTSEVGTSAIFSVQLSTKPVDGTQVVIIVNNGDTGEIAVDKSTLTFTDLDYQTPQTVTVTGVDDGIADGNQTVTVALFIDTLLTTDDANYDPVDPPDVVVTNIDNTLAVTVTPTSGLLTTEAGGTDSFSVVLNTSPAAGTSVVIDVVSADTGEVVVDKAQLTFSDADWQTPQVVTVTGVDDAGDPDGNIGVTVNLTINGAGTNDTSGYALLTNPGDVPDVTVTNVDGDTKVITVEPLLLTTSENRTTDTFTVSLSTAPSGDVLVNVFSPNTAEVTVDKAQLTFTTEDWATPQTVTVTGVNDTDSDGDVDVTIAVTVDGSSVDTDYKALNPADPVVTNLDNEIQDEGTAGSPVELSDGGGTLPHEGEVSASGTSYFHITGLTPGDYLVSVSSLTEDVKLFIYSDAFTTLLVPEVNVYGTAAAESAVVTVTGTELWVKAVSGSGVTDGVFFTLDVIPDPVPEGSLGSPTDISLLLPGYFGVVDTTVSYYKVISGLANSTPYLVRLTDLRALVGMDVFDNSAWTVNASGCSVGQATIAISCQVTSSASGELYLQVNAASPSSFVVDILDIPVDEGTIGSPLDLTGLLPYGGQMITSQGGGAGDTTSGSFYVVENMIPGATVTVSLANVTDLVELQVYSTADFITTQECISSVNGTEPESCIGVTVNPSGILYIRVASDNGYAGAGATYLITVTQ